VNSYSEKKIRAGFDMLDRTIPLLDIVKICCFFCAVRAACLCSNDVFLSFVSGL
jgi:hypothetical protein